MFLCIRLCKYNTDTPFEDSQTNAEFRTDEKLIIPQGVSQRIAWEAPSNPSVVDHSKIYRDPTLIGKLDGRHPVTQQNDDENRSRRNDNAGHSPMTSNFRNYVKNRSIL